MNGSSYSIKKEIFKPKYPILLIVQILGFLNRVFTCLLHGSKKHNKRKRSGALIKSDSENLIITAGLSALIPYSQKSSGAVVAYPEQLGVCMYASYIALFIYHL